VEPADLRMVVQRQREKVPPEMGEPEPGGSQETVPESVAGDQHADALIRAWRDPGWRWEERLLLPRDCSRVSRWRPARGCPYKGMERIPDGGGRSDSCCNAP
jgi:hypothetical protein